MEEGGIKGGNMKDYKIIKIKMWRCGDVEMHVPVCMFVSVFVYSYERFSILD